MKKILLIIVVIAIFIGLGSFYIVKETDQTLIVEFGNPKGIEKEPGLHFKKPFFMQDVITFDKRILELHVDSTEFIADDQKKLIIDAFTKYKITDPLKVYQTVKNEYGLRSKINELLDSQLRRVIGQFPLHALLTDDRVKIMNEVRDGLLKEVATFGVDVVDVRIMRADLPQENSQKIYKRMQTEREREAKEYRAQGAEEAQIIRATAEKERAILLADANKSSLILRGDGDAEATRISAEAFTRDEKFYAFYRSMEAYRKTLQNSDTSMVLSPKGEFLRFFGDIDGQ